MGDSGEMTKKPQQTPSLNDLVDDLRGQNKQQSAFALGERIAMVRNMAGWSQTKLAKEVGVSRGAVGQWESGKTEPSAANLREIAVKIGVDYDWLATGRGYAPDHVGADPALPLLSGATVKIEITLSLGKNATLAEASAKLEELKKLAKAHGKISGVVTIGGQKFDL